MARDKYRLRIYNHSDARHLSGAQAQAGRPHAEKLAARHPPPGRAAHIRRPARAVPRRGPASARYVRGHAHRRDAPRRARGIRSPGLYPPRRKPRASPSICACAAAFPAATSFPRTRPLVAANDRDVEILEVKFDRLLPQPHPRPAFRHCRRALRDLQIRDVPALSAALKRRSFCECRAHCPLANWLREGGFVCGARFRHDWRLFAR